MSRDQNAGQSHSMKIDNSSFERVKEFKYLGTMLTNQNSIQEEIKSRLKSGNACYHSVQNLLSSSLLSKNLKIKIYRTITLPVVLYGCEKIGRWRWGRNVVWGCLRIGCWGNYIMRNLMICTAHPLLCKRWNQNEWDGQDIWHGGGERRVQGFGGETWGKETSGETQAQMGG